MQDRMKPADPDVNPTAGEDKLAPELGNDTAETNPAISRRLFVQSAGLVAGAVSLGATTPTLAEAREQVLAEAPTRRMALSLTVNGEKKALQVDPRVSLLDLLREDLELTGTKKGCDHGQCGACTVLANGRRVNSCLSLALVYEGGEIMTIEGLAHGDILHPVQTAFLDHDGYQCGYCTPGQIISAVALLDEVRKGEPSAVTPHLQKSGPIELTGDEVRERMSGNICRCGAYPGIVAAVQQAFSRTDRASSEGQRSESIRV